MYRAPLKPLCGILLASLLASVACKSAPTSPMLSDSEQQSVEEELRQHEADRLEILAAQKQLEADIKLAEEGWPADKPAPKVEATYSSKGGKLDDEEIIEIKTQIKKATESNERPKAQLLFKNLLERCRLRKAQLSTTLVKVEVNIQNCKQKLPRDYGDAVPDNPVKPPVGEKDAEVPKAPPPPAPKGTDANVPEPKKDTPDQKK